MRRTALIVQIVLVLLFISTSSVCGFGGAKALGMGNAFVAIADDGTAPYWNPAGITQMNFGLTAGVGGNPFSDYWYYNAALHGGITTKYLAINMFGYCYNDDSEIDFVGTIGIPIGKQLAIGGNYKLVNPEVSYNGYTYNGSGQSIDIGILYRPFNNNTLRVGLVAYDINHPRFIAKLADYYDNVIDNQDLILNIVPTYVTGIAWKPLDSVTFATDFALLPDSYRISCGAELVAEKILALRAGFYKYSDIEYCPMTLGAGLKLGPLYADIAFVYSNTYISAGLKF